jgi:2-oxoglutarate dehydrogenase E2 component (dihydrolipoamide succinyltransferase)
MRLDIKVPAVGESVQEAVLAQWFRRDGERVQKDEILFLLETDKVTLEIVAEADGILHILEPQGKTIAIGAVIGFLESEAAPADAPEPAVVPAKPVAAAAPPALSIAVADANAGAVAASPAIVEIETTEPPPPMLSPSVRRLVATSGIDSRKVQGTGPGGRITKGDVLLHLEQQVVAANAASQPLSPPPEAPRPATDEASVAVTPTATTSPAVFTSPAAAPTVVTTPVAAATPACGPEQQVTRQPMSRIRLRIAERLLEARLQTAMLTTFNEIDMTALQAERTRYKESFRAKHGVSLGVMSFFIKGTTAALQEFPELNAFIDGKDMVYHHYYHIGVAVGAERGLVVPVIRHADHLSFAQLEQAIVGFVQKIKDNRLELADLEGGTFTITNGGVYGSLLSTPILNTPQSGILGMHKIEDRPVAVAGQVVIRPMMYVALSYDHRLVDGRQAVTFLKRIKEYIENPERIMLEV